MADPFMGGDFKIQGFVPGPDDIVIQASITADVIDGTKLHDIWQNIVVSTHPNMGFIAPNAASINPSVFLPLDEERFMAIRTRACSSLEKWGANMNHDGFPAEELKKSYLSMIGKGFYQEHASFDPRNAVGILAHAQWYPDEQYVVAVALVDKIRFPREAESIKRGLANGRGVSIGCIAGTAECSVCHKIAKKKQDLCAHLTRGNPLYAKGRIVQAGQRIHSICRDLTFYELSYVKNPADRDALSIMVVGAEEPEAAAPVPEGKRSIDITMPNDQQVEVMVNDAIKDAFKLRVKKLVKDEVYRQFEDKLRKLQINIKPEIRDKVEEKKDEVAPATAEEKEGGDKKNELESKV